MHKCINNITKENMAIANNWYMQEALCGFKGDRFLDGRQSEKVLWDGRGSRN